MRETERERVRKIECLREIVCVREKDSMFERE